jgi:phage terminase large subunit-like protein
LIADGEDGAEVDLAANSKEQAKIAFGFCKTFTKQLDPKSKYLKAYRDSILLDLNNSKLKVFAADDTKLDGFNASFGLIDEFHSAKNSKVRDVIKSSMGMRQNPHLCTITTAGFDKTLPCYRLRETAIEILNGLKQDDSMFIAIYSLDTGDDWTDENNWVKCAPNLDVTVTSKYIKEQVLSAINNPSEEVGVKTKTLNLWCDVAEVWLPESYLIKATTKFKWDDFKDCPCYVGVDLAATNDLTAVSYMVVKDGIYHFKTDYYVPESALVEKADRELYKYWKRQGLLKVTKGNVTDYDYITNDMMSYSNIVSVQKVGYDKYNSTQWAITATDLGLPLEEYPQSLGNFNKPTREMERLILSGKAKIDNNEITRWCFKNVTLKSDHNGNVKPNKSIRAKKIDGVIAMIQALGMYLDSPHFSNQIITI